MAEISTGEREQMDGRTFRRMNDSDTSDAVKIVLAWHRALNAGDVDALADLVATDVEISGLTPSANGFDGLRAWVERTHIQMVPRRVFEHGALVVVEQSAAWWSPDDNQLSQPVQAGSVFEVQGRHISRVERHPDIARALEASGLTDHHVVMEWVR